MINTLFEMFGYYKPAEELKKELLLNRLEMQQNNLQMQLMKMNFKTMEEGLKLLEKTLPPALSEFDNVDYEFLEQKEVMKRYAVKRFFKAANLIISKLS